MCRSSDAQPVRPLWRRRLSQGACLDAGGWAGPPGTRLCSCSGNASPSGIARRARLPSPLERRALSTSSSAACRGRRRRRRPCTAAGLRGARWWRTTSSAPGTARTLASPEGPNPLPPPLLFFQPPHVNSHVTYMDPTSREDHKSSQITSFGIGTQGLHTQGLHPPLCVQTAGAVRPNRRPQGLSDQGFSGACSRPTTRSSAAVERTR